MPKEYLACVASEKKRGKSLADAKRICAIAFWKRHGETPQRAAGETAMTVRERIQAAIERARAEGNGEQVGALQVLLETGSGLDAVLEATKKEDGEDYPASAFAYVPDADKPSTWKLRLWESPSKKVTVAQVGRAAAAFSPGGFRGQKVQIPAADIGKVKSKIRATYRKLGVKDEQIPKSVREALLLPPELQSLAESIWANIPFSYEYVQERLAQAVSDGYAQFGIEKEQDRWQAMVAATFAETVIVRGAKETYYEAKWALTGDGKAAVLSDVKPVTVDVKIQRPAAGAAESVQEVYAQVDGSYEAEMRDLRSSLRANPALFGGSDEWDVGLEATFADRVVVRGGEGKLFRAAWTRSDDGTIGFSDIRDVKVELKVLDGETIATAAPEGEGAGILAADTATETTDLLETFTAPVRVVQERDVGNGKGGTDHLMTVECLLGIADTPTRNGRVYTKGLFENLVAECKDGTARSKRWLGEGDHPSDGQPRLMDTICTPWRNLRLDGSRLLGETDIIDTSKGADVQKLVRNGVPVQTSSRTAAVTTSEVRDGLTVEVVDEKTALANFGGWDFVLGAAAHEGDEIAGVRSFREKDGTPAAAASPPSSSEVPGDNIDEVLDTMTTEELQRLIQEAVSAGVPAGLKVLLESEKPKTAEGDGKQQEGEPDPKAAAQGHDDLAGRVDKLQETLTSFVEGQAKDKKDKETAEALALGRKAIMETDEVRAWPDPARKLMEQALGEVVSVDNLAKVYEQTQRTLENVGLLVIRRGGGVGISAVHVASTPEKSREDQAKEFQRGCLPDRFLPETKDEAFDLLCEGIEDNGLRSGADQDDRIVQMLGATAPWPGFHPGNPRHVFRVVLENVARMHPEYLAANLREFRPNFRTLLEWTGAVNVAQTVPYVLPIIRQVWARLQWVMELMSVQPMTKSTGVVHFLDFLYDPSAGNPAVPGQFVSDYAQYVSEQAAVPEVMLQLTHSDITMDTKKLKAEWSSEVRQNLRADHGLAIEAEMVNFMADEIAREVVAMLLNTMRLAADPAGNITAGNVNFGCLLPAAGYVNLGEWQKELYRHALQADGLVRAQRRGRTNWMVAGQNALIRLMRLENWSATTMDPEAAEWDVGINRVGTLDGNPKHRVYGADPDFWPTEVIMVGRKGPDWYDSGMVYCPFIPMYTAPLFVDPNTFCERIAVMSRFGYAKVVGNSLATVTCLPAAQGVPW